MPDERPQIHASWEEAPRVVLDALAPAARPGDAHAPRIVGITGPVGSGKSTLAARLGGVCIATDHYLPDYDTLAEHERDEPVHAALDLLAQHLAALRLGQSIEAPLWSFQTHRRAGTAPIAPAPLIVCEGLFALRPEVRASLDLAVYVDAPRAVRWARWEAVERAGLRGWGVERARAYFERVAEPTFEKYAGEYRRHARIVVLNEGAQSSGESRGRRSER